MLSLLNQYSRRRFAWFLLFLSTVVFELIALHFQYNLGLAPCTLCIYQRCAIFGIMIASFIGFLAPRKTSFRLAGIFIWLISAFQGFRLAKFHAQLQFEPSFGDMCSIKTEFPSWLPLDTWLPEVFSAYGSCSEKIWSFLTIEMSQWMIIIFACYFIVGLIILFMQLFSPKESTWHK